MIARGRIAHHIGRQYCKIIPTIYIAAHRPRLDKIYCRSSLSAAAVCEQGKQ